MFHYYTGILRKLSLLKIINYVKLMYGFYYSRISSRAVQRGLPVFLSVEPTTSCNLRCPQCPSGLREFSRPTGMLQTSLFENLILQVKHHLHSLTFYFQGEPYLNPDFLKMVSFATSNNIYTITSTNGHYLSAENAEQTVRSGLDKLTISIDGITQESYELYRKGGRLEKVLEGTREIVRQKKRLKSRRPHVVWQFVVFSSNEKDIEAVKRLGKEMGVDEVKIKTAQIYDFENGHDLIPEQSKYSRYEKEEGKYRIKNELKNECLRMWQGCTITWDGKVVPCCFDKDAKYRLGDLGSNTFSEIWFSEGYQQFRNAVLTSRKQIDICTNCTEGARVWS